MKRTSFCLFALASLLAGCNSPEKQAKAAVSEYISNSLGEPGYYRPEQFVMRPYTRKDSVAYATQLNEFTAAADTAVFRDEAGRVVPHFEAPKPAAPSAKLAADATPIATYVRHTYREQSPTGRIMRDSGEFVVYATGQVVALVPGPIRQARLKQMQARK